MKKVYALIFMLVICGCSKESITEIDPNAFGYEASYNLVNNSFANTRNIVELEDGIMYFATNLQAQNQYMIYINNDNYQIANADIGSICDFNNIKNCTGSFESGTTYQYFNFYMGQLYYLYNEFNEETELSEFYLGRCDLDGSNKEKLLKLNRSDKVAKSYSISITFHRGFAYYTFGDNVLRAIKLETMEDDAVLTLNDNSKIDSVYMIDDNGYIDASYYEEDGDIVNSALLKLDLKNNDYELYQKDMGIYLIDGDDIIYTNESKKTFLYNMKNKETKTLLDTNCIYKVSTKDYFLLDSSDETLANAGIYLFDNEGNQLDYVACNDFHFGYGIVDNKYYFMDNEQLMYYEIIDGKFQEPYIFEFK